MSSALVGVAYIWLAQGIAFLLMPRSIEFSVRIRAIFFWAISAPVVLLIEAPLSLLIVVAALMILISPAAPSSRTAFFLIAAPAVPVFITSPLPFPGINHLLEITHYKIASLIVLTPVLFAGRERQESAIRRTKSAAVAVVLYVAYASILNVASYGITEGLRFTLNLILAIIIPFFAITLTIRSLRDVEKLFEAVLLVSIILATVALVSVFKRWDIYAIGMLIAPEWRGGFPRINATAGTHSLAFHLALGIAVLEYLKSRGRYGLISLNLMRATMLGGMLTTDSRGAMASLVVAFCMYNFLTMRSNFLRGGLFLIIIAGIASGAVWLTQGNVNIYDQHGTFSYRQELLQASIDYIARHPLFGDRHFLQSGHFDHLLQGQGIIDITNLYLQVTLAFGLIGLVLFSVIFIVPIVMAGVMALRLRGSLHRDAKGGKKQIMSDEELLFRGMAVMASSGAGWLFLIATTSDVGLTLHLGVVLAAICFAMLRLDEAIKTQIVGVPKCRDDVKALASSR